MKRIAFAFAAATVTCFVLHKVSKTKQFCELAQLGVTLFKDLA